jgi:hypothetical protein
MTQILITGMHRSGTTITFDLLRRHPEIVCAVNEGVVLDRESGSLIDGDFPNNAIDQDATTPGARPGMAGMIRRPQHPGLQTWLTKMSFPGPIILQQWCDSSQRYLRCWLENFGPTSRLIHIVRHPFAVFDSVRRRWAGDPIHLQNYGAISLDAVCRDWALSVSMAERLCQQDARCMTVLYEDLVSDPQGRLIDILGHCEMSNQVEVIQSILGQELVYFGKVDQSRAMAYKNQPMESISRSTSWLLTPLFEKWGYADR